MRTSSDRRHRDAELRRAAANRRVGHDNAYLILFGPEILKFVVLPLLVAAAATWAWFYVDHARLAGIVGFLGILILAAYAAWSARTGGLTNRGRMMAMAEGRTRSGHWHLAGLSGLLMLAAAVTIWVQLP